ncbi:MAG: tryptophan 7-halogenase [Pirellulales bacterium]|nr:tryptophan 7-halogenase [Pirellulales bacterium]
MNNLKEQYDCIIVGGGPAGSSAATIVSQGGFDTLLLEREAMPRYHIGESLMPEAFWCFERLGVLDQMRNSDYVRKVSVQFVSSTGKESQPFFFKQHDPRECSSTWQVERAEFDHMLFKNAAANGASCVDQARVMDVLMDGDRAVGVTVQTSEGTSKEVRAKVVVDATGLQAVIANRMGLRRDEEDLKKIAIWSYFENAEREPGEHGGATIILHTEKKDSWFWFIPLRNGITSVGVVGDRSYMLEDRGSPEQTFADELALCPAMQRRLALSTNIEKYRVAREFSYTTTQQSGDGWVLVGDAMGFIDPIYSSGVYFALQSGIMAADVVVTGLRNDDTSATQLASWVDEFKEGTQWIRKLVDVYYCNPFSMGRFLKMYPQYIGNITDLLIGRIFYDGAGAVFQHLDPAMQMAIDDA